MRAFKYITFWLNPPFWGAGATYFRCSTDNQAMTNRLDAPQLVATVEPQIQRDSLIDYPCDFPVKVIGPHHPEFVDTMVRLAQGFDPEFGAHKVELRASKTEKYLGITLIVRATSRAQLDGLYLALTGHPMVKVAL